PTVARFVDRYWLVTWDLTGQEPYTQQVFAHPVVNVVFADDTATVHGVTTSMGSRVLEGAGRALGIMFRPAGFRPFLGRSMSTITDRALPMVDVFGPEAATLERHVLAAVAAPDMVAAADGFLAARVPGEAQSCERISAIVERASADASLVRVDDMAAQAGISVRQLQRQFGDEVGVSPKAVIRRYRLYEAAERARLGTDNDWAALATELGYSDQSHLTRDFTAAIGMAPDRYARACRA
ncbi:MAG TPA: AraC family transcriptional regulator, partial [Acidimicrobiales bacterium]|nr:AraC family transcriptional regulator [Acidimicrobiales bacterium]